jgi:hypothetical protein
VLSCDVIIWDDNTPLFIFPENFTHSFLARICVVIFARVFLLYSKVDGSVERGRMKSPNEDRLYMMPHTRILALFRHSSGTKEGVLLSMFRRRLGDTTTSACPRLTSTHHA